MQKILAPLAIGSALVAVPAFAQDVAPASPFEGPHVEAVMGYDITRAGSSSDNEAYPDDDESSEGFLYGVGAGYDFDFGNVVIGPEAEITGSTAKTKFENGDFEGFGLGNVKMNRDIYVGARAGYKVAPTTLLYVKGGYTNAKFDVVGTDGDTTHTRDIDADGWRIGAGLEQAVTNNMFARLEYRYSNYGKAEFDYTGDVPDSGRFGVDLDRHQVVGSVGVRF